MDKVSTDQYARLGQSNLHGDMQVICVRTKVGLLISVDLYSYRRKMLYHNIFDTSHVCFPQLSILIFKKSNTF